MDNVPESKEKRNKSRAILLEHLKTNCREVYQPQNLEEMASKIECSLAKKQELEEKLANLNQSEKKQADELRNEIKKENKNIQQYLKEINWNNVSSTTQAVVGVASVAISLIPLCRIM